MYYKKKPYPKFYKNEMIDIYNIIINDNIIDKEEAIKSIGDIKKLELSLTKGFYTEIDNELRVIKDWFNKTYKKDETENKNFKKGNQLSERQMNNKISILLYLKTLYFYGCLNEKTYYPIFKKLGKTRENSAPTFKYLLKSKNLSFDDPDIKEAFDNVDAIEEAVSKFYEGTTLKNLKYRRTIEEVLENSNYLENYNYAEYLMTTYINSKSCYRIRDLILSAKINEATFEDCVSLIKFLNPVLYNNYLFKRELDDKRNNLACYYTFENLANKIVEYRNNGTDMPKLEFLSKAPFLGYNPYQRNLEWYYVTKVESFIEDKRIANIIISYLYRNGLSLICFVNTDRYLNGLSLINGYALTDNDKNNIKTIMKSLNITSTSGSINEVIRGYLNNEYDLTTLKGRAANPIEKTLSKNPYEYVKSK